MASPALFLPGVITPAEIAYRKLTPELDPARPVRVQDLALFAHGAPPPDYRLEDEVAAVLASADAEGWDRFHIVGYSGGAAAAATLATLAPGRLLSLTLIEPAWLGNHGRTLPEQAAWDAIIGALSLPPDEAMAAFARLQLARGVPPPPRRDPPPDWMKHRPAGAEVLTRAFMAHDLNLEALAAFDRPVLFIRGGRSNPDIWPLMAKRAAALFSDFRSEVFPERHHFDPPQVAEPAKLAAVLEAFWKSSGG